mmetsp:Transcript_24082/g.27273  ORF Transcript_24082/g.27273 Transcript_24082/m.27273 type:complete len:179 (+) Transcript_24082:194-730(+)|eukprot:CAMPEP_0115008834 /NCGR_PEP_ID=MMETSP0216-20121206/22189_1 /TAXON_ID=223996 /ORGANISM="Protocruzia adherens, Strain Boccale" /LENGTH=178 /DNA_ID=CAMNT_0002376399 /DNA_START=134 /DNA_END=670 /DNA_ORIENTATION=-
MQPSKDGPFVPHTVFSWDPDMKSDKLQLDSTTKVLKCIDGSGSFKTCLGALKMLPGRRYYFELKITHGSYFKIGVTKSKESLDKAFSDFKTGWAYYKTGQLRNNSNGSGPNYGENFGQGDTIGVFLDTIDGILGFTKNGKYFGTAYQSQEFAEGEIYPACACLSKDDCCQLITPIPED